MTFESLIRRAPEIAFAVLFGAGLVLGGGAALAGLPKFVDATLPGMAAEADVEGGHGLTHFALPQGFAESRFAPQVLHPVSVQPLQDWPADAMVSGHRDLPAPSAKPVIAICIDDLGEDLAGTDKAMGLPKAVALSFLPYAETTPFLAQAAARRGHLILAHVPMEALGAQNPGLMVLKTGMAANEIARRLAWDLDRVPGLVGINNHEGSRFTADAAALAPVMAVLRARHLFFFDSRTGPGSLGIAAAQDAGVMAASRDIFLDDDPGAAAVSAALDQLARQARRDGVAIAIGHPHDVTLKLLAAWLAKDHGVTLVPLDEAMRVKAMRATVASDSVAAATR